MRKLMWFAAGFAGAAVLSGYWLKPAQLPLAAAAACLLLTLCLLAYLKHRQARLPALILFGMIVGLVWNLGYDLLVLSTPRNYDGQRGRVEILIMDAPTETNYGSAVTGRITLNGRSYRIWLYLDGETEVSVGDRVAGIFTLRSTLSGAEADSSYHRGNGVYFTAGSGKDVTVTTPRKLPYICHPAKFRQDILGQIDRLFPEDAAAFAKALLLGDTKDIDYETDTALKISGIRHVVSVSGLHVSILFAVVYFLTGRRRFAVALLGLPTLLIFAAVAGFSPSITRACLMHGIMVLSMLTDREYDGPTSLAFAVTVMLAWDPLTVLSVSFQLSVSCMIGIFLFAEPVRDWLLQKKRLGRSRHKRLTNWFATSVGISIGTGILTTPLCALYFGTVSLLGILTNLLTVWITTYVFYGIMLACIAGAVLPFAGIALAWVTAWGIRYVLGIAGRIASIPCAAVYTESIYMVFWLGFCYVLLAAFLMMKKKRPMLFGCCTALGLCVALLLSWSEPLQGECRVTVLDVGQGQCILLQSEGRTFLVDCGGDGDAYSADLAARTLLSQGISRLDGVFVTHYDRDHAGGVPLLLTRVPTDSLFLPLMNSEDAGALQDYRDGQVMTVSSRQVISYGNVKITVIPSEFGLVDNESGLCILFQTKNCDILITGDRSEVGERELMKAMELPKLELLIAGHHGSKYSTSQALLDKTSPEFAIVSAGRDNPYGHPAEEVLRRLAECGCIVYRTDRNGTVIFRR